MDDMQWYLGDDYYCETCGDTFNTLLLEEMDPGVWVLYMSVGCYGGDYTSTSNPGFKEEAAFMIANCLTYDGFSEVEATEVRNAIKEILNAKSI
jgi:hypothetical protein